MSSAELQRAAQFLTRVSQGQRIGINVQQIANMLNCLVSAGAVLSVRQQADTCTICRSQRPSHMLSLACGHSAHHSCIGESRLSRLNRPCQTCGSQIYLAGVPKSANCCICQDNIPQDMFVMTCGEDAHFYCQRDFDGMVEASIAVQSAQQIKCGAQDCSNTLAEETLLQGLSPEMRRQLQEYRKTHI